MVRSRFHRTRVILLGSRKFPTRDKATIAVLLCAAGADFIEKLGKKKRRCVLAEITGYPVVLESRTPITRIGLLKCPLAALRSVSYTCSATVNNPKGVSLMLTTVLRGSISSAVVLALVAIFTLDQIKVSGTVVL